MNRPVSALADAAGIHVLRFLVMWATLEVAGLIGIDGWWRGLAANVVLTVLAIVIVTRRGLWRSTGLLTRWRSSLAALALLPLMLEALSWLAPAGVDLREPGPWLWGLTLLLVGVNEELFSRGIVLTRLASAYRPAAAVVLTAALFGLQHLSALVLTSRGVGDVLGNVALSAMYGLALAAFQLRFHWLWPLILIHATADWTTIMAARPWSDAVIAAWQVVFVATAIWHLRRMPTPLAASGRLAEAGARVAPMR